MYVASVGPDLLEERMRVGRLLWSKDISAEYSTADNPKFPKQMNEVRQSFLCLFTAAWLMLGYFKVSTVTNIEQEVECSLFSRVLFTCTVCPTAKPFG